MLRATAATCRWPLKPHTIASGHQRWYAAEGGGRKRRLSVYPSAPRQKHLYTPEDICHACFMRIVLDTNVLYAGIRSSLGASRILLELLMEGYLTAVLSPALFLEYEERLCGDATLHELELTDDDLVAFLDELASRSIRVRNHWLWRPVSSDPDDDMVIECAVNGYAEVLVTFNTRDLQPAHDLFGILVLTPAAFLARFGRES